MEPHVTASRPSYRDLVEHSFGLICTHDLRGTIRWVSPAVETLLGYPPSAMVGRSLGDFLARPDVLASYLESIAERRQHRGCIDALTRDGELRFLKFHNVIVEPAEGDPYVLGHAQDVTELILAERELQATRSRISEDAERFFQGSVDLLCVASLEGYFTRLNPQWEIVLGHPTEELLARPLLDFVHPANVEETARELAKLGEGVRTVRFENRCCRADGSYVWLQWSATTYGDEGVVYASARDVSRLKLREEELTRARLEADGANKAKGEFLANVSHEIRTPINGIIGMTELALDTPLTDQQREYLHMVQSSALALLDVINGVLDFSKIEAGKLQIEAIDFTLRDTLTGALKPLALVAEKKGIELLYDEGRDVPERLRGDPGRLRQVLVNLVGNAVKFTESGEVDLTTTKVRDLDDGLELRFEVRDTGTGIPAAELEHVFEAFSQADGSTGRRFGGTGLGLSIASGIVETMGGRIEVESEEGAGSTFAFHLPFGYGQEVLRPPGLPARELRGRRVLVVDDNATNRRIMRGFLGRMELEVADVPSGVEALEHLDRALRAEEPFEMVVLDIQMPNLDGFEVAGRIRADERFADLVLVAVTAVGRPGDGALCEQLGISSYLLKPLTPTELRDAIHLTLGQDDDGPRPQQLVTRHSLREAWQSLRVLLAEDNRVNQKLAVHILESLGHEVTVADNGREALDLLESAEFDLILMDIQMPEMGGIEATRLIREREERSGRHVPIVALTAHAREGDRERFLEAGMDEYISKPIGQEQLREVVGSLGALAARGRRPRPSHGEGTADSSAGASTQRAPDSGSGSPLPFDRDALMERVDFDPELLRTLVGVFKADSPLRLGEIEEALLAEDTGALATTAHTMKGALSVFGAEPARSLAEQLEDLGRQGRLDDVRELYARLGDAIVLAQHGLDRLLEELE
ncbi:MAG TPA: response regulator [Longimicrobiales bacterium]|nr:response regulator [Longimicrobiales bacterium]